MGKSRRKHGREFKLEAVKQIVEHGRSAAEVADSLGVSRNMLVRWKADQLRAGHSRFTYRPFTLGGNFLAMQAVHEMLLQSWGGTIRLFPAMPWRWHDASFAELRAEEGSSSRRRSATTTW